MSNNFSNCNERQATLVASWRKICEKIAVVSPNRGEESLPASGRLNFSDKSFDNPGGGVYREMKPAVAAAEGWP
jgi:hypothetical protein